MRRKSSPNARNPANLLKSRLATASLDIEGGVAMFRATFEKPEPQNAQYYYQAPYCSRTQAHRRGWLRPSKIGRCAGVLLGPFLFSKTFIFQDLHFQSRTN